VKDKEIVLNLSFDATSGLKLGNDYIEFKARFSGVARDILVPVNRVMAIYARETSQGMAFPNVGANVAVADDEPSGEVNTAKAEQTPKAPVATRPSLKIVK
jgi:stringent starvation protein B